MMVRWFTLPLAMIALSPAFFHSQSAIAEDALRDVVDREITAAWAKQKEKVAVAKPADDAEFLRRIYLDLVGAIPTYEEAVAFLDDASPDKRSKLIDKLLADPRFAQQQADAWDMVLFGRSPQNLEGQKRDGFQQWLVKQFAENVPYDQMVRTLLKAEGNSAEDGPPLYYVRFKNQAEDMTEAVTQTFLGIQLQCARCHDHPFDDWKQVDFYGMASFLARTQVVSLGKKGDLTKFVVAEKNSGDVMFTGPVKDQKAGKQGTPIKPKFLHGSALAEPAPPKDLKEEKFADGKLPPKPAFSRKDKLAEWIAAAENPYFAKAVANRVWAQYMGKGLVYPVDNLSDTNPASHPQLLEALSKELVAKKFDLKWYIRELVNSKSYQLSARSEDPSPMPMWHNYARFRPLTAEELIASWRVATWFDQSDKAKAAKKPGSDRMAPLGEDVMRFFGTPTSGTGDFQGGLSEHLFLNNGPLGQMLDASKGGLIDWLQTANDPVEKKIERLYLSALSRRPTAVEVEKIKEYVGVPVAGKASPWGEVAWALLSCSEFRFNH